MLIRFSALMFLMSSVSLAAEEPMSAIDWLSQSVRENPIVADPNPEDTEDLGTGGAPEEILVTPLSNIRKDTAGLLPASVTGLPVTFWRNSSSATIQELIVRQKNDPLPEVLELLYKILLAEFDAPENVKSGSNLLLVRVDKLLALGALEQAQALLERAGPDEAEVFRRWFDVSLLTGREDHACSAMAAAPGFAPTLQARVFCLARNGDWNAAALTVATGETLGFINQDEADLLTRFLDPDIFEGQGDMSAPEHLTPLVFTMREAIAQPRPAGTLPLAFQYADLRPSAAWRNQLEAAERLVRSHALDMSTLIELYTEKQPAASGGIWDRAAAIQAFDVAVIAGDSKAVGRAFPNAYAAMAQVHLEVAFANHYGDRITGMAMTSEARDVAFKVALLSKGYETAGAAFKATTNEELFLLNIAQGKVIGTKFPRGNLGNAIADAFRLPLPAGNQRDLLQGSRLGEAVLTAMALLKSEAFADPGDIQVALATFRAVGLEEEARRIALQLLILDRRG